MAILKVGPEKRDVLVAVAASLRRRAEQIEPPYSTRQIIDACFPCTTVTGAQLPSVCHEAVEVDSAAFRSHRAPHLIVYRRGLSTAEQRHAIAHAVGHVIFDGPGRRDPACDAARELRCDMFADELLVPLVELMPYVAIGPCHADSPDFDTYLDMCDQIASHFHVTSLLIDQRIRELRSIA